jgi:hypothetical protein
MKFVATHPRHLNRHNSMMSVPHQVNEPGNRAWCQTPRCSRPASGSRRRAKRMLSAHRAPRVDRSGVPFEFPACSEGRLAMFPRGGLAANDRGDSRAFERAGHQNDGSMRPHRLSAPRRPACVGKPGGRTAYRLCDRARCETASPAVGNAGGVDVGAQGLGERLLPGQASRAARRTKMGNAAVCNNAEVRTTATSERSYNTPSRTLPANQATP